jgi:hypothetical protein
VLYTGVNVCMCRECVRACTVIASACLDSACLPLPDLLRPPCGLSMPRCSNPHLSCPLASHPHLGWPSPSLPSFQLCS